MILKYEEACKILDINIENISQEHIKKQYRLKALQYHPDKNSSTSANEEFIRVNDAYEYLIKRKNNERNKSYSDMFSDFIDNSNLFHNDENYNIINTIFKNIILECEDKTLSFLSNVNKHNLSNIINIIKKYKSIFIFNDELINRLDELYNNKINNEEHIVLNPLIDDLLEDNVYKFQCDNEQFIIPLWHAEVYFTDNEKEIHIYCNPLLPSNINIDCDNNIFISIRENVKNIFDKEKYYFNIGKQVYHIDNHLIKMLSYQEIILKNKGISKINSSNILNNKNRGDIIIKLNLIFN
jgi:hypothetical protein